jgi:hypothetical protein
MSNVQLTDESQPAKELDRSDSSQVDTPNPSDTDGQPAKEPKTETEETKVSLDDGTEVTIDELKSGYMKDSDYRQKTEALAREREQASESKINPDVLEAVEVLKGAGVATKDDLAQMQASQADEKRLQELLDQTPELKAKEKAIRAVGQTDNAAWEDIVTKYGFTTKDKLAEAKANRPIVGDGAPKEPEQKGLRDMSEKEYEAWKQQNLGGSTGFFKKQ